MGRAHPRTERDTLGTYENLRGRHDDVRDSDYNDALVRLERTKTRRPGESHPWVVGKEEVGKYLTVVQECARAWLAIGDGRP